MTVFSCVSCVWVGGVDKMKESETTDQTTRWQPKWHLLKTLCDDADKLTLGAAPLSGSILPQQDRCSGQCQMTGGLLWCEGSCWMIGNTRSQGWGTPARTCFSAPVNHSIQLPSIRLPVVKRWPQNTKHTSVLLLSLNQSVCVLLSNWINSAERRSLFIVISPLTLPTFTSARNSTDVTIIPHPTWEVWALLSLKLRVNCEVIVIIQSYFKQHANYHIFLGTHRKMLVLKVSSVPRKDD